MRWAPRPRAVTADFGWTPRTEGGRAGDEKGTENCPSVIISEKGRTAPVSFTARLFIVTRGEKKHEKIGMEEGRTEGRRLDAPLAPAAAPGKRATSASSGAAGPGWIFSYQDAKPPRPVEAADLAVSRRSSRPAPPSRERSDQEGGAGHLLTYWQGARTAGRRSRDHPRYIGRDGGEDDSAKG